MMTALALPASNLLGSIPVRNIWLLMAYAADFSYLDSKTKSAFIDNSDDLPDLVATLLCKTVEKRLCQGLSQGFLEREADLHRVRGRIDILKSETMLLQRGKVACRYTELSNNTARNRYVLSALLSIAHRVSAPPLARRIRNLTRVLQDLGVSVAAPTPTELSQDRLGRHDYKDREMIDLAKMASQLSLPSEQIGETAHYAPDKNEYWVRKLFEKAIAGFYKYTPNASALKIRTGMTLKWPHSMVTTGLSRVLPNMRADITIDDYRLAKRLVIDTKFNSLVTAGWMREETLRSGYLYQIYAYLRTQEDSGDTLDIDSSGLLLHPSVGESFFESMVVQKHKVSFATIDLTETAEGIKEQLLTIYQNAM
jgi:5-methylcytosine-specific restriction enzyme subunit McrC